MKSRFEGKVRRLETMYSSDQDSIYMISSEDDEPVSIMANILGKSGKFKWLIWLIYTFTGTVNSSYSEHNLQQYFVHYMERFTI